MSREVVTERISRAEVRDGRLHFTTVNPRDASDITDYEMWRDEEQGARISISDVPAGFEPMRFTRAAGAAPAVFAGWEPGCSYQTRDVKAPSAEMQQISDALRRELGVPVLAAQAAQQRDWAKQFQSKEGK